MRINLKFMVALSACVALVLATSSDAGPIRRLFQRLRRPPVVVESAAPPVAAPSNAVPFEQIAPPKTTSPARDVPAKEPVPTRDGFVTAEAEGRWWIFRAGSKDLAAFQKGVEPEKSVTRINVAPYQVTLKAPDIATMEDYLTARPGFVTRYDHGRLWVFREGAREYAGFQKHGDLEKHVARIGAGPRGMTIRAPDAATIDAYLKQ